jgi:hypothetical protein
MRVKDTDAIPSTIENAESKKESEGKFLVIEPAAKERE